LLGWREHLILLDRRKHLFLTNCLQGILCSDG
jgi:hypothetical protein